MAAELASPCTPRRLTEDQAGSNTVARPTQPSLPVLTWSRGRRRHHACDATPTLLQPRRSTPEPPQARSYRFPAATR
ncbi:hypothetical protein E2562_022143 [Oryza meyeriana var. granulata]|uniref:Uncharacterized protein n=1 Tax=Oryza meyeriana var. granulata TaxID=110450 RepID=A0A6G1BMH8_9ORYZ|nr:hypothetical protein E2562_022143 [Oryza meyeriana var. granulata]